MHLAIHGDRCFAHRFDDQLPDEVPGTDTNPADGDTSDAVAERRAALEMLVRLAHDYERLDVNPTADGFASWLRATVGSDAPDRDAVDVTTFHAAKGLEWPVVHLTGIEKGLVPIGHATTDAAQAEERRLFYVALTRAEEHLHLTWAEARTFGERTRPRQASPYLVQVQDALDLLESESTVPTAWPDYMRAAKERLNHDDPRTRRRRSGGAPADLDPADAPLFEALRSWRARRAKAANVPAFVIFSDATLVAVAGTRPANRTQLLALPGIGPVKVERHGDDLLAVVNEHAG
jgi:DNA helicase-2/ATP-dependent DNA helicase PcrA